MLVKQNASDPSSINESIARSSQTAVSHQTQTAPRFLKLTQPLSRALEFKDFDIFKFLLDVDLVLHDHFQKENLDQHWIRLKADFDGICLDKVKGLIHHVFSSPSEHHKE